MSIEALTGRYILLTTYRRDGTAVPTTVWFARIGDEVVVPTGGTTGKVKRIRNNPSVTMVTSGIRGKVKSDVTVPGTARFLDGEDAAVAKEALRSKYGFQWRMFGSNTDTMLGITPEA